MVDRLLTVTFATAHVGLLTLAAVLLGHAGGSLGPVLDDAGTVPGTVAFLVLWGVALLTHHRALASVDPWRPKTVQAVGDLLFVGVLWGAATGVAVFWLLVGGAVLVTAPSDPAVVANLLSLPTLLLAGLGTLVALAVGAAVGAGAAALDALVLEAVDHLDRTANAAEENPDE